MYIPDPIELLDMREEAAMDRVETVDGVYMYPCDDCGELTPINEIECMDTIGVIGICPTCFDRWCRNKSDDM